jgi:hypothetical protein
MELEFISKLKGFIVLSVLNNNEVLISKSNKIYIYNISIEQGF